MLQIIQSNKHYKKYMQVWFRKNRSRLLAYSSLTAVGAMTVASSVAAGLTVLAPALVAAAIFGLKKLDPVAAKTESALVKTRLSSGVFLRHSDPLYKRVADLAGKMGVPAPRVAVTPSTIENDSPASLSLASHRYNNKGIVFLPAHIYKSTSAGREPYLTTEEQDTVLAHELAHLKAKDSYIKMASVHADVFIQACAFFSIAGMFFWAAAPAAAAKILLMYIASDFLVKYADRRIEDACDEEAVRHTRSPGAFISSLRKLEGLFHHHDIFAESTRDIKTAHVNGADMVTYYPKKNPESRLHMPRPETPAFIEICLSHPVRERREKNIYSCARNFGIAVEKIPEESDVVEIVCTPEGAVLPPFAIEESVYKNPDTGQISVITALPAFNRTARIASLRQERAARADVAPGADPSGPQ